MTLLWLAAPQLSYSALENTDEILVQADSMRFDLETGSSIYEGNVSIIRGGMELTGDSVIINRIDNEIRDIKVDGNPAQYRQDESTDNKVDATSQHMRYVAHEQLLVLTVKARLEQSSHTVVSERIVYDTQNKVIIAGKHNNVENTGDRVNITLTPEQNAPSKKEPGE